MSNINSQIAEKMSDDRPKEVDATEIIDARLSGYQILIIGLCASVALLDGYDTQSIGVVAPRIAAGLGIGVSQMAPVFAAGLFGAMVGALTLGVVADRLGRKSVLVIATIAFGLFTLATAFCGSIAELMACRFLAGVGLGGATPCFIALTAEYSPTRSRGALISAMWAAFPIGGVIGGIINPHLMAAFGWPAIFYVGAALPIILAVILAVVLPESLRYLIATGAPIDKIRRIVSRISPAKSSAERFVITDLSVVGRGSISGLFANGRATGTLLLWALFFSTFMILVFTPLFAVPLLAGIEGLTTQQASMVVVFANLGSAAGTLGFGRLHDRFGSRRLLVPSFTIGAMMIAGIGLGGSSVGFAALCAGLGGFMIAGGSACAITLASAFYPTEARSTGLGWAMGMGRLGQVAGPLIAGALLANGLGAPFVFPVIGAFALVSAACVGCLAGLFAQAASAPTSTARNAISEIPSEA